MNGNNVNMLNGNTGFSSATNMNGNVPNATKLNSNITNNENKAGIPNTVINVTVIILIGIMISNGDITKLKLYSKKILIKKRFITS